MNLIIDDHNQINKFSLKIKNNILDMAFYAGVSSSHFGGALSIVDIVAYLFSYKMKINKNDPQDPNRDRFILSKGHACLAYYASLCELGFIKKEELKTFEKDGSNLLGHPVKNKDLGIDFSNGSLGMGLSLGIGVAIALKKKQKKNSVYVVLGDGECNEGSVWEAAMTAPHYKLDNLIAIIDRNNFQQTGKTEDIMNTSNLVKKWESFGWLVREVDGHNLEEIHNSLNDKPEDKPLAIVANTIKGKGFLFSENNNDWHHAMMTKKIYEEAKLELKNLNVD